MTDAYLCTLLYTCTRSHIITQPQVHTHANIYIYWISSIHVIFNKYYNHISDHITQTILALPCNASHMNITNIDVFEYKNIFK